MINHAKVEEVRTLEGLKMTSTLEKNTPVSCPIDKLLTTETELSMNHLVKSGTRLSKLLVRCDQLCAHAMPPSPPNQLGGDEVSPIWQELNYVL